MVDGKAVKETIETGEISPRLMVRSDAKRRVSNHEAARVPATHPSRRPPSLRCGGLLRMRRSKGKKSKVRVECRVIA
jgi:hypothetical protein